MRNKKSFPGGLQHEKFDDTATASRKFTKANQSRSAGELACDFGW
jgi:hypothetical protein